MNLGQYAVRLKGLADAAKQKAAERIIIPAANELLASKKNTIQRDGERTDGNKIGSYSTKPMYASRDQFVKRSSFKAQGKKSKKKGAKSMYLPGGYKELRDIQGRPTDRVNLTYSGDTLAALQLQKIKDGALIGFVTEEASKIRKGLEKHFRAPIFSAQKDELDVYNANVAAASKTFTMQFLNGNV